MKKIKLKPDVDRLVDVFSGADGCGDFVLFQVAYRAAEKQANSGLDAGAITICEMIHKFRLLTDAMIADAKLKSGAKVVCSLCGEEVPEATAHIHQGKWIGDECCWDERLRSSE
jgi:formylmethanofuran dehydrogenase subunit E